jgi:phosphate starvation-inducible PhoH-like protein
MNAGFQKDIGFGCVRLANTPLIHLTLVPRYISEIDNIFTTRPAFFAKTALESKRKKDSDAYEFDDYASDAKKHHASVKTFQPKTENQKAFLNLMRNDAVDIIIAIGPAGTGKTMLACYAAVEALRSKKVNKIVITRPVVSVDEDIGFLPGSLESKMDPWTRPIFDTLRESYSAKEIETMLEDGIIEIVPLGFMRGRTFKNTWIIADEMQNSSPTQMFMLATRIGEGSKMIITGDLNQSDLNPRHNGLLEIYNKVRSSERRRLGATCVRYVELDKEDVQRSRAAKTILDIYEEDRDDDEPLPLCPRAEGVLADEPILTYNDLPLEVEVEVEIAINTTATATATTEILCESNIPPETDSCENTSASSIDLTPEWVEIENDAALIPLKHIKQLKKLR